MENKLIFTNHVVNQMNNRNISLENVKHVLATGVIIREYPEDKPFPSFLILGYCDKMPLHVVFSLNENKEKVLITAYWPDSTMWNKSFNIKKK